MIDIFKNNLDSFDVNNNSNNIICNANEIENSPVLDSLSPAQKSSIHLNVKVFSDKDIENFVYLEQNGNYKSINLIISPDFNLSRTACEKLSTLININSVLKCNTDGKFKGCSFKNYSMTTAVVCNKDTTDLLSSETLYVLKNFTKKENYHITLFNINYLSKAIFNYFKEKQYTKIFVKATENATFLFNIDLLYVIFERISNYTNSINLNIENTIKFNIIYTKILEDIKQDNEKINNELYNDLSLYGYTFILYQTLLNLNIKSNLVLGEYTNISVEDNLKNNSSAIATYYVQVNFDKYWFNLDIVWNYKYLKDDTILKNDKEFFKTHSTKATNTEKCSVSYKKFYKKYKFFKLLKNKFFMLFNKEKKEYLGLPEPNANYKKHNNTIFQEFIDPRDNRNLF